MKFTVTTGPGVTQFFNLASGAVPKTKNGPQMGPFLYLLGLLIQSLVGLFSRAGFQT